MRSQAMRGTYGGDDPSDDDGEPEEQRPRVSPEVVDRVDGLTGYRDGEASFNDAVLKLCERAEQSTGVSADAFSTEALFAIVTGDDLTEGQRREVFEVLVDE